jgi:hypothetical protein
VSSASTRARALPLLAARDLDAPLAWRDGRAINGKAFLTAAAALAQTLPASGRPINLCQDRLHFALGLAAALMRKQTSLMPPNTLPATLRRLPAAAGPPYVLADFGSEPDTAGLPLVPVRFAAGAGPPAQVPLLPVDQQAVCLLTSGSTGAPQPHAKRWGPLVANIAAEAERLAQLLDRPSLAGLSLVATVPAQHSYGFESSVLLALLGGAAFDAGRPFYPADIAAALAALPRPRALVTTPFHLKALVRAGITLPAVDLVLSATAPLSPQLAAEAEGAMHARLVEIYGCTEAGQVASRRTTAGDTWTTLGELRIASEVTPEGERFFVHGGHVVEPTPLADVLVLHDARHFHLLGRANDLIHVAGKRSSLAHLNFQLNRIDGVVDGAFWLPETRQRGDTESVVRPVAFVVAPRLSARQIIAALRVELESAFVPRRVIHVDALPREATGKLTAGALREFAQARIGTAPAAEDGPGGVHRERIRIGTDHPAFAGHFPGHPLLPGVVILSLVMRTLERQPLLRQRLGPVVTIEQVKFLAPVGPDSQLCIELAPHGAGVAFDCSVGGRTVARSQLGGAR